MIDSNIHGKKESMHNVKITTVIYDSTFINKGIFFSLDIKSNNSLKARDEINANAISK